MMLFFISAVSGGFPQFCNTPVCQVFLDTYNQKELYVHVPQNSETNVDVQSGLIDTPVSSFTPLKYSNADAVSICSSPLTGYKTTSYNEYLQVAEYGLQSTQCATIKTGAGKVALNIKSGPTALDGINVLLKFGTNRKTDVMEIIGMPISQFNTHGYYWAQQQYYYVYLAVCAGLALLYIILARCRLWQMLLVFAMAAFAIVWSENLYQSIFASRRAGSQQQVTYTVLCVVTLANLVPFIFCMLFMKYGKCRPIPWSVFGLMVGAGFLFLAGSGWFVGPGCIILASIVRLTQRTALNISIN